MTDNNNEKVVAEVIEAELASAVPIFPPKPDAIATLITTDDFLPGVQTLMYSVKKSLPTTMQYQPELVVLVTPNVSQKTRSILHPAFCTRIIEVEPIQMTIKNNINTKIATTKSHVDSWTNGGALTKLHIFNLDNYDTLVYVDADCLVVKDITEPLLNLGKVYVETESLIAAVPDIFPPGKFNAGVMVVRPNKSVFKNMLEQRNLLRTYDGGDTGYLNSYFSNWFTDMPPYARLPYSYNAQRFMFHCTYEKQPNYWDVAVAPDLAIIHYSSSPKPWETTANENLQKQKTDTSGETIVEEGGKKEETAEEDSKPPASGGAAREHLDEGTAQKIQKAAKHGELEQLWRQYYQRARNYYSKYLKEQKVAKEKESTTTTAIVSSNGEEEQKHQSHQTENHGNIHKKVTKRYKQLRSEGLDMKEAMAQARSEHGLDKSDDKEDPRAQVAAMFGM